MTDTPLAERFQDDLDWREGHEVGVTENGSKLHICDFHGRSILAIGSDEPHHLMCGLVGEYERAEPSDNPEDYCQRCIERALKQEVINESGEFVDEGRVAV